MPSLRTLVRTLIGIAAVASALAVPAQGFGGPGDARSRVELVSELDALVPGTSSQIGLLFEIDDGWHIYQASQNDTGLPPAVAWSAEAGLGFGAISWPAGHRFVQPGSILDHGYEGTVLLMVSVDVPAETPTGGTIEISASLEWLACDSEQCVPGFADVSMTLPVRTTASASDDAGLFDAARTQVGRLITGSPAEPLRVSWEGSTMVVTSEDGRPMTFVPGQGCASVEGLLASGVSEGEPMRLTFDPDEAEARGVTGWVWLGSDPSADESGLWLVRTGYGVSPMLHVNEVAPVEHDGR